MRCASTASRTRSTAGAHCSPNTETRTLAVSHAPLGEDYRFFDLARRYGPVALQQPDFLLVRNQAESAPLVEADRPGRRLPGADEKAPLGPLLQMFQQVAPDSGALLRGSRVRVPDQRHVGHMLQAHDARYAPVAPHAEEIDAGVHLGAQLVESD